MKQPASDYDVVVLGAGAAGMMCAMTAGARGRRVLLIDHAPQAGAKILISGGGRCNFTNEHTQPDRFLSANPRFSTSALRRYAPADFIALVRKHGIAFHEKALGQLFCDGSARAIVAMLLAECSAAGVEVRLGQQVTAVSRADRFRVETGAGDVSAPALVLATGGLSIPKMGATGFSHDLARRFGLPLTELRPGLVPLTFGGDMLAMMQPLSGVALPVSATAGRQRFDEAMLFTHRGCPARRSCKSRRCGGTVPVSASTCCPAPMHARSCWAASGRGRRRRHGACWRRCCRRGWRRHWLRRTCRRAPWRTCRTGCSGGWAAC